MWKVIETSTTSIVDTLIASHVDEREGYFIAHDFPSMVKYNVNIFVQNLMVQENIGA